MNHLLEDITGKSMLFLSEICIHILIGLHTGCDTFGKELHHCEH